MVQVEPVQSHDVQMTNEATQMLSVILHAACKRSEYKGQAGGMRLYGLCAEVADADALDAVAFPSV